jgi:hypothetical protein
MMVHNIASRQLLINAPMQESLASLFTSAQELLYAVKVWLYDTQLMQQSPYVLMLAPCFRILPPSIIQDCFLHL